VALVELYNGQANTILSDTQKVAHLELHTFIKNEHLFVDGHPVSGSYVFTIGQSQQSSTTNHSIVCL
jgi:hypothetical protein